VGGGKAAGTWTMTRCRTHAVLILYSCSVLIHCTHTPYSYTVLILRTHTPYSYFVLILRMHTLYSYCILMLRTHTVLILRTHTPYSYSTHTLYSYGRYVDDDEMLATLGEWAPSVASVVGSKCSQCRQCYRTIHCLTCSDLLPPLCALGSHPLGTSKKVNAGGEALSVLDDTALANVRKQVRRCIYCSTHASTETDAPSHHIIPCTHHTVLHSYTPHTFYTHHLSGYPPASSGRLSSKCWRWSPRRRRLTTGMAVTSSECRYSECE
jgi:hypothetical protein